MISSYDFFKYLLKNLGTMQMIFINIDRTEKSNSMTGCIVADDGLQEGGEGQGGDAGGQGGQAGGGPLHI